MEIKLIPLQVRGDERGGLIALEQGKNVPFEIKRVYYLIDTKLDVRRGYHAHRLLKQLVVAVRGRCQFLLDDGTHRQEITLERPDEGLLLSGLVWREMFNFSEDCVLMVLASELYEESDYIRNYEDFLAMANANRRENET